MANKQKINSSKNHNPNEYVSVVNEIDFDASFNALLNSKLEKNVNIKQINSIPSSLSPKKKSIKFSSISKSAEPLKSLLNNDKQNISSAVAARTSVNKKYPVLSQKFANLPRKSSGYSFRSKSSRELDLNTLTTSYNFRKSPSESNTLTSLSSFSVVVDGQGKNKDSQLGSQQASSKAGDGEQNSQSGKPSLQHSPTTPNQNCDCNSKSSDKNISFEVMKRSASPSKNVNFSGDYHCENQTLLKNDSDRTKNKRRHIAELKTEIAEYRNNKKGAHCHNTNENVINVKRSDCQIKLKVEEAADRVQHLLASNRCYDVQERVDSSGSKSNMEDKNIYDSVAVILQNRVIIPNSEEYGSYPLLPNRQLDNISRQFQPIAQQMDASEVEADISEDEASVSGLSTCDHQIR